MAPITRIIAFKYKDDITYEQKQELLRRYDLLLKEHAETSSAPRSGKNRTPPQLDRGFDIVVTFQFPNRGAVEAYDVHPAHDEFKVFSRSQLKEAFIYEFDNEDPPLFELEAKQA